MASVADGATPAAAGAAPAAAGAAPAAAGAAPAAAGAAPAAAGAAPAVTGTKAWTCSGLMDGKRGKYIRIGFYILTLFIAAIDLISDCIVLSTFISIDGGDSAIAMGVFVSVSVFLFVGQVIWICICIVKLCKDYVKLCKDYVKLCKDYVKHYKDYEYFGLLLKFGLLLFEHLPCTLIIFVVLTSEVTSCDLFRGLFELSLIGIFKIATSCFSALCKVMISIFDIVKFMLAIDSLDALESFRNLWLAINCLVLSSVVLAVAVWTWYIFGVSNTHYCFVNITTVVP